MNWMLNTTERPRPCGWTSSLDLSENSKQRNNRKIIGLKYNECQSTPLSHNTVLKNPSSIMILMSISSSIADVPHCRLLKEDVSLNPLKISSPQTRTGAQRHLSFTTRSFHSSSYRFTYPIPNPTWQIRRWRSPPCSSGSCTRRRRPATSPRTHPCPSCPGRPSTSCYHQCTPEFACRQSR